MWFVLFFSLSFFTINAADQDLKEKYVYTILGYDFTLPDWVEAIKNVFVGPTGVFTHVKDFITGNSSLSTEIFGTKFALRAPKSQQEVATSVSRFFTKVRDDHTTRIFFVIYLNLVVMFIIYTLLLVRQVQLSKEHRRQEKIMKKQRKLEECDRKEFLARAAVIHETELAHADILRRRADDLYDDNDDEMHADQSMSKKDNHPDTVQTTVHQHSTSFSLSIPCPSRPRLLGPEMFSPILTENTIQQNEEIALSPPRLLLGKVEKLL